MLVVFRCDASIHIGSGHIMRCLTLADTLSENGASCCFICRLHEGNMVDYIKQRGYETHDLPIPKQITRNAKFEPFDYQQWLGADIHSDASETLKILKKISESPVSWIIVDHYALDKTWEQTLRPHCKRIMVIDDLANRNHDCELLLDQNLGRSKDDYKNLTPTKCTRLIGSQYALLRPEFAEQRESSITRRQTPKLEKLLITLGGVDKDNITECILNNIQNSNLSRDCKIVIVMGIHSPWVGAVKQQAAKMRWKTEVLINIEDMALLMAESDLCIGAAGTSSWERCCVGLPSLLITLAENQKLIAKSLHKYHAAIYLGDHNNTRSYSISTVLNKFLSDLTMLQKMSNAALSLVDGSGNKRVLESMQM